MAKGNKNPIQTEAFLAMQKPRHGEKALGRGLTVRFSVEVEMLLKEMGDRQDYVRRAVERQLKDDGLL